MLWKASVCAVGVVFRNCWAADLAGHLDVDYLKAGDEEAEQFFFFFFDAGGSMMDEPKLA